MLYSEEVLCMGFLVVRWLGILLLGFTRELQLNKASIFPI